MYGYDDQSRNKYSNSLRAVTLHDQVYKDTSVSFVDRGRITLEAGIYGVANNFINLGKWAGMVNQDAELIDIESKLNAADYSLGQDYYEHKNLYDVGGALVTSLVPGGAAIGGLRLASRLGNASKIGRAVNFLGNKAKAAELEIETAYKSVGRTADVGKLSLESLKWNTLNQAVEGAVASVAIETTLNAGNVLNDDGLSAMEKISTLGFNVGVGAVVQGAVGGAWAWKAAKGNAGRVRSAVFEREEAPYLYVAPTVNASAPTGTSAAATLQELNRIHAIPADTAVSRAAKDTGIAAAKDALASQINSMYKVTGIKQNPLLEGMLGKLDTEGGRSEVAGILTGAHKLRPMNTADFKSLNTIEELSPSSSLDTALLSPDTPLIRSTVDKLVASIGLEELNKLSHATNGRGLESTLDKWELLNSFVSLQKESGWKALKKKNRGIYDALKEHTDSKLRSVVFRNTHQVYLDGTTGDVLSGAPIHLGDKPSAHFNPNSSTVSWKDVEGTVTKVGSGQVKELLTSSFPLKYQAARFIAAKTKVTSLANKKLDKFTDTDWVVAETALNRTTGDLKIGTGKNAKVFPRNDVLSGLAEHKADVASRFLNAGVNATDTATAVGVSEKFIQARGLTGKYTDAVGSSFNVVESDYVHDASQLLKNRTYVMEYASPNVQDYPNAGIFSVVESERKATLAANRARVDNKILRNRFEKEMPTTLGIDDVTGYGTARFTTNASQIGGYQGTVAVASQVGETVSRMADDVFEQEIVRDMSAINTTLLASDSARAEYVAFAEWYSQQSAKLQRQGKYVYTDEVAAQMTDDNVEHVLGNFKEGKDYWQFNDPQTASYLKQQQKYIKTHVTDKKSVLWEAQGQDYKVPKRRVYLPPRNYAHMTFLIKKAASPLEAKAETVYRVTADTASELRAKVHKLQQNAKADGFTYLERSRKDVSEYKNALRRHAIDGEELTVDVAQSSKRRKGALPTAASSTGASDLLAENLEWFRSVNQSIHGNAVEVYYADDFARMRSVAAQDDSIAATSLAQDKQTSVIFGKGISVKKKVSDFEQVLATATGADSSSASLWKSFNNSAEEWTAKALTPISRAFFKLKNRKTTTFADWEKEGQAIQAELKQRGIGLPQGDYVADRLHRETQVKPQDLRKWVSSVNAVMATMMFRLDAADSLVNVSGAWVKAGGEFAFLRSLAKNAGTEQKKLYDAEMRRLFGATTTDKGLTLTSTGKMFAEGYRVFFTANGKKIADRWTEEGLLVDTKKVLRDNFEDIKIDPEAITGAKSADGKLAKFREKGKKLIDAMSTPSDFTNMANQFAILHAAESLGNALGMHGPELRTLMHSMNRRVNAIANPAQKPRLFQGSVGLGISLYQSYMFHMMNNLFKYADRGIKAAPAMVTALNGTFFGAQSVPGFQQLNTLIGAQTDGHTDIYGVAAKIFGNDPESIDMYDFMVYGAGAALTQSSLFTRGDLNPRTPTLIPTSLIDIPAVQVVRKAVGAMADTVTRTAYGDNLAYAAADEFVNIGLSRPLKGLWALATGRSTNSRGDVTTFVDDVNAYQAAVRLAGFKPMNEALMQDYQSRLYQFKARDIQIKKALGHVIKNTYHNDPDSLNDDDTLHKWIQLYQKAGGTAKNFDSFLARQMKTSETDLSQRLETLVGKNKAAIDQYHTMMGF